MAGSLTKAFFLDIPYLIDSAWRHTEYALSAECNYPPGPNPQITLRRLWRKPPFWFFAVTVFFVSYGPTWSGLCAVAPKYWTDLVREILGVLIVIGSPIAVVLFLGPWVTRSIMRRFTNGQRIPFWRRGPVVAVAWIALLLVTAAAMGAGSYLYGPASGDGSCAVENGNSIARWQLGICTAAIVVFAFIMALKPSVKYGVIAQGVILGAVALIQFFVLAGPLTLEHRTCPIGMCLHFWRLASLRSSRWLPGSQSVYSRAIRAFQTRHAGASANC